NVFDTWPDLETGVEEDQGDGEEGEEGGDVVTTSPPLDEGELTEAPSPASSESETDPETPAPTVAPTGIDAQAVYDELFTFLVDQGIVSENLADDPDSPQFQATTWLAADPSFYDYGEDRIIQRWALGVMAYSMDASRVDGRQRMQRGFEDEWLAYTDECTWFTSGDDEPCDAGGNFVRLDIQDMNLGGNLPGEISLLSNS
ncbi:MAG: hypothetical protein SGILL_010048, partial [Bacillariaceae sp.]